MRSPWGSFDVIIVPDDDEEARAEGYPDAVLDLVTKHDAVMDGSRLLVRATIWERIKHEFENLGKLH